MNRSVIYIVSLIALFFLECSNENNRGSDALDINQLAWFNGRWVGEYNGKQFYEFWAIEDEKLSGKGFFTEGLDTIITERLSIEIREGHFYYTADVHENEKEVPFKSIKISTNMIVFQNTEHDFPRRITYIFNEQNNLYAKIEGKIDGKKTFKEFFFKNLDR